MVYETEIEELERGVLWRDIKLRITDPEIKEDFDERHLVISLLLSEVNKRHQTVGLQHGTARHHAT